MTDSGPYDDLIMDHIRNARNFYVLDGPDREGSGANPLCGDELRVFMKVRGERIETVSFQCTCCGISMASASVLTEQVAGRDIRDAKHFIRAFREKLASGSTDAESSMPAIQAILATVRKYPARAQCAALAWTTLDALL